MKSSRALPFSRTLIATAAITSLSAFAQQENNQLDVVTVTAGGYEQSVKDAPASVTVISAEEINKKSYADVTDVLKNVPGVYVSGGGAEQSIMIRGMTSDYTLFLVDGRPQQDNQAFSPNGSLAGAPINFLPPIESIERIEVIRGPASSLYGSDAIGGVVNIITKKVDNKFGGTVSTEYILPGGGNHINNGGYQGNALLNIPLVEDKMSLQISGGYFKQRESDYFVSGDSTDPEFQRRNIGAKFGLKINAKNTITLGLSETTQVRTETKGKSVNDADALSKSIRKNYFFTHEGKFDDWIWENSLSFDESENPTRGNASTGRLGIFFDTLNANTQATFFKGDHTITGGLNFKGEKLVDNATNVRPVKSTLKRDNYALFLEDNWQISDDLSLLLSGRYDYSDKFGGNFSPKVYAVYDLNRNLSLKGGVASGYKVPSLRNSAPDFAGSSMGGGTIGSLNLQPETTDNIEIGLNFESDDKKTLSSVTVYKTEFTNKIERSPAFCVNVDPCIVNGVSYPRASQGYTSIYNVDSAESQGLEWTLDRKISNRWSYRHSYSYTKTQHTAGDHVGKPLNDVPKHMFNASLDYKYSGDLSFWTQFNFRGRTTGRYVWASGAATNGVTSGSYAFTDVGLVYGVNPSAKLKLGVYNLFNKRVDSKMGFNTNLDGRRYIASMSISF